MYRWVYMLSILSLSASHSPQFYYSNMGGYRKSDACTLCYSDNDCLVLEQSRCDYYLEVNPLLRAEEPFEPENGPIMEEVDQLLFEFVQKASVMAGLDCIPYLSHYTNCNKENLCTGCATCACDNDGKWDCKPAELCRTSENPVDVNYLVLATIIDRINMATFLKRRKRSTTRNVDTKNNSYIPDPVSYQLLTKWLYGEDKGVSNDTTTLTTTTNGSTTTTDLATIKKPESLTTITTDFDTDYVEFDDVLQNIAIDTKNYSRRKPPLDMEINNTTFDLDYMLLTGINETNGNDTDEIGFFVNLLDETTVDPFDTTNVVEVDLLKTVTKSFLNTNFTDDSNLENDKDEDITQFFDNQNDFNDFNVINIMKRDISSVNATTDNITITPIIDRNETKINTNNTDLNKNILWPLNKVIFSLIQELDDLKGLRNHLLNYLNMSKYQHTENDTNSINNTNIQNFEDIIQSNNSKYLIENITTTQILDRFGRNNKDIYNKYLKKLKFDIFEVLRDIVYIQKHKTAPLPKDIIHLIRAMKMYVTNNNKESIKSNLIYRRNYYVDGCTHKTFKECLVRILQVMNKNRPKTSALASISMTAQRVIGNVIKYFYTDEIFDTVLRINDNDYNLTKDLQDIGTDWRELATNLINSTPFDLIYRMKLLHFVLKIDISKMNDALSIFKVTGSRRMNFKANINAEALKKINTGFQVITRAISGIIEYYLSKSNLVVTKATTTTTTRTISVNNIGKGKDKKHSFLKHIKNLLKTSKNDIAALLHRKVPKSDIIKHLAKRKLDELTQKRYDEYQETMKRWQNNLGVVPRTKRSLLDKLSDNIKSIIPKYLRHKVRPKIHERKKNESLAKRALKDSKKKNKRQGNTRKTASTRKAIATTRVSFTITTPKNKKEKDLTTKKPFPSNKQTFSTKKAITTTTKKLGGRDY